MEPSSFNGKDPITAIALSRIHIFENYVISRIPDISNEVLVKLNCKTKPSAVKKSKRKLCPLHKSREYDLCGDPKIIYREVYRRRKAGHQTREQLTANTYKEVTKWGSGKIVQEAKSAD